MSYLWNSNPAPIITPNGNVAAGASIYFYTGNSTTPLIVYQDAALTVPHAWPVVANTVGVFPAIYVPYGSYRRRIVASDGSLISDASDIDNPAPPSGGGGIVVTSDQIFQTGDPIWRLRTGQMLGFVRMNGQTLGSLTSGATEYAAANAVDLFEYLWNNLPDSIAAVSTGRGATAAADFAANKTIVIPTMQGYLAAGLDDMGAAAANTIQTSTTCSATNGLPTIIVASATGIGLGMYVIISGVAAGQVDNISGTTITLDTNYTGATGGGKAVRFSWFANAQQIGQAGGHAYAQQTIGELAAHIHTVTDPGHQHTYTAAAATTAQAGVTANVATPSALNTGANFTGVSVNSAGFGAPSNIVQPTRLVTWYMKL